MPLPPVRHDHDEDERDAGDCRRRTIFWKNLRFSASAPRGGAGTRRRAAGGRLHDVEDLHTLERHLVGDVADAAGLLRTMSSTSFSVANFGRGADWPENTICCQ